MLFCGWLTFPLHSKTPPPQDHRSSSSGTCWPGLDGLNFVIWSKVHDKFTSVSDVTEMNLLLFFFVESVVLPSSCRMQVSSWSSSGKGTKKLVSFPAINLRFSGKFVCWMCCVCVSWCTSRRLQHTDLWMKIFNRDDVNWCQMVYHFWFHCGF